MVKNLPSMQETQVQPLGREDPLEKGMTTPVLMPGEFYGQGSIIYIYRYVYIHWYISTHISDIINIIKIIYINIYYFYFTLTFQLFEVQDI